VRLFYVVAGDVVPRANFPHRRLDLGNGSVLMSVDWSNEVTEMQWAALPGVWALPHPVFEQGIPLNDEHLVHLSSRYPVEKGHNVRDLLKMVTKDEPLMRVWATT
jgi:hypothetical protein